MMGMGSQYGGAGMRMGGQALGAAGMLGMLPSWKSNPASNVGLDMLSNIALMSGNPVAMAAGGAYKGFSTGVGYLWNRQRNMGGIRAQQAKKEKYWTGVYDARNLKSAHENLGDWSTKTLSGVEQQKRVAPLLAQLGIGGSKGGEFIFNRGVLAAQGMTGVKTLRGELGSALSVQRQAAIVAARRAGYGTSEEELRKVSPEYARMADLMKNVEKLLADMASGKMINVQATVILGDTPAGRLTNNSGGGGEWQLNAPNSGSYGAGVVPFFVPSKR